MDCPVCRHQMEEKRVRHLQEWEDHVVVFEGIQASVCPQCGEKLLSGETVDRINHILWSMPRPSRKEEAAVYKIAET